MLSALRGAFRTRVALGAGAATAAAVAYGAKSYAEAKSKPLGDLKLVDDSSTKLDLEIQQRFLALDQGEMVMAEYVWIGVRTTTHELTSFYATSRSALAFLVLCVD